jgi:hypothetical protein
VEKSLLDNLLDLGVGDGALFLEGVDGATGLDEVEELGGFGCHVCFGLREVSCVLLLVEGGMLEERWDVARDREGQAASYRVAEGGGREGTSKYQRRHILPR